MKDRKHFNHFLLFSIMLIIAIIGLMVIAVTLDHVGAIRRLHAIFKVVCYVCASVGIVWWSYLRTTKI